MPAWLALIDPVSRLLDKLIPDPEARARAQAELLKADREADLKEFELALSADKMQADINLEEAKSDSLFVSGWRPAIGWTCALAYLYHFVLQPFLAFALETSGVDVELPDFEMEQIGFVLAGMLGLGAMRSIEKIKGTDLPWRAGK